MFNRAQSLEPNSGHFLSGIVTQAPHVQYVGASATLDATDVGSVHLVQVADKVSTLPATVAGIPSQQTSAQVFQSENHLSKIETATPDNSR